MGSSANTRETRRGAHSYDPSSVRVHRQVATNTRDGARPLRAGCAASETAPDMVCRPQAAASPGNATITEPTYPSPKSLPTRAPVALQALQAVPSSPSPAQPPKKKEEKKGQARGGQKTPWPSCHALPIFPRTQPLLLNRLYLVSYLLACPHPRDIPAKSVIKFKSLHHPLPLSLVMAMNNKNWNDRADKDLFFTILTVKNIGVISGAEWTMIGNYMRSMGYGFTNEGCRQHFQGLRRATNKIEAAPPPADLALRKVDPSLNPITRRPGPGRGRPRKSEGDVGEAGPASTPGGSATPLDPSMSISPGVGPAHSNNSNPPHAQPQAMETGGSGGDPEQQQLAMEDEQALAASAGAPFSSGAVEHGADATDEHHPSKRQRLDADAMDHESALDDEAVLALAAHNGTTASDYPE
ncbi:hypothetical protein CCM_04556 [Cordyceps militaris CM01]|uniref:Uncharacterized protein n=1 Tax=Cordyceps militaris (strain CM01) TaxID=983644 RepID=G3JFV0_CORMM|nr:uncharacterized protein CCM_04556 [Cordyceps militaris CM01]EGX93184.1 hypothetical protein CCM_04556 [Cordyceps militaris CM01]